MSWFTVFCVRWTWRVSILGCILRTFVSIFKYFLVSWWWFWLLFTRLWSDVLSLLTLITLIITVGMKLEECWRIFEDFIRGGSFSLVVWSCSVRLTICEKRWNRSWLRWRWVLTLMVFVSCSMLSRTCGWVFRVWRCLNRCCWWYWTWVLRVTLVRNSVWVFKLSSVGWCVVWSVCSLLWRVRWSRR